MMTKKALRASAKARKQGSSNHRYLEVMGDGEKARKAGLPQSANPYAGTDWDEAWDSGWEDESI